jgi:hypothetical protein
LKFLGLESWPPSTRKIPILVNFEADLKKYTCFFGPGPMRDVYLDFRLPWPAKISAGISTPEKWRPFEIYLTTNGFFTKTKEASISQLSSFNLVCHEKIGFDVWKYTTVCTA